MTARSGRRLDDGRRPAHQSADAEAVLKVVGTAVDGRGAVAELVAVAQGVENGHGTPVVASMTAPVSSPVLAIGPRNVVTKWEIPNGVIVVWLVTLAGARPLLTVDHCNKQQNCYEDFLKHCHY